jgi:hypothetical protein
MLPRFRGPARLLVVLWLVSTFPAARARAAGRCEGHFVGLHHELRGEGGFPGGTSVAEPVFRLEAPIGEGGTALIQPIVGRPGKVAKRPKDGSYDRSSALDIARAGQLLHEVFPERSPQVDGPIPIDGGFAVQMDRLPAGLVPLLAATAEPHSGRITAATIDQVNEIFRRMKQARIAISDPNLEIDPQGKIWLCDPDSVVRLDLADPVFQVERHRGPYGPSIADWEHFMEKNRAHLVEKLRQHLEP